MHQPCITPRGSFARSHHEQGFFVGASARSYRASDEALFSKAWLRLPGAARQGYRVASGSIRSVQ